MHGKEKDGGVYYQLDILQDSSETIDRPVPARVEGRCTRWQ